MKFQSLLLAALLIIGSRQFAAATLRSVTSTNDGVGAGTLRTLIANSVSGDAINFSVTGIIYLTNELDIGRNISINGPGGNQVVVSGSFKSRVFNIVSSTATVQISGLTISGGSVIGTNAVSYEIAQTANGGGILNSGVLTLTDCIIAFNSATGGYSAEEGAGGGGRGVGGGISSSGPLTLVNCTVAYNSASGGSAGFSPGDGLGGGIYCDDELRLTNSLVWNNSANGGLNGFRSSGGWPGGAGDGGGIHVQGSYPGSMVNCTIAGNSATGANEVSGSTDNGGNAFGGGLSLGASFTVASCTINGNSSVGESGWGGGDASGGGIYTSASLNIRNSTISGNLVTAGMGSYDPNGIAVGPDINGAVASAGHNLIGATNGSSGWVASDLTGTMAAPLNPSLGPLQDNGGPTLTMALPPGSPALDAGDDSVVALWPFDQRGNSRLSGAHVDIGAFELNQGLGTAYVNLITTTSNLLGYWRFDPVFQANSCVNGYTGTLEGNAQIGSAGSGAPVSLANQGLVLDGVNSYLETGLTGQIGGQGTILAWVYLTSQPSTAGHYFEIASQSAFGNDFDLSIQTDNHVYFYTDNGTATSYNQPLPLNQWHFLAATFVTNTSRFIYLDGGLVALSIPGSHAINGSGNPFTIGASHVFGGRYLAGRVSDVAVYNRALSAAEIYAIYSAATASASAAYLAITRQSGGVVLSWLTNNAGYTLQQNTNLATPTWMPVPGTPAIVGQQYVITNPATGTGKKFYRLSNP